MSKRVISAVLELKDKNFQSGMKRSGRNLSDFERQSIRVGNNVENMAKKAVSGFKMIGTAAVGLAAGGITALSAGVAKTMLDMDSSFATLQAQTGTFGSDFADIKSAAIDTFKNGYGNSLDEVTSAISRVKQNMKDLDNGAIANVTSNAMLLAKTFDSDVNEVTRGVSNTMQAFGVTADKAFDLFTAGGQRGLNFSNEMFDNVAEYASLFGTMGYTAEEYFGILERGSQAGIYNLDFANDIMKEFQIRVKDGSKKTGVAMSAMSKSTQNVWKEFLKGNGTVADVTSKVVNELKIMDDQVKAGQLGVELFGVKFEDMEADAVYSMLGTTEAMKDFEGATKTATDVVEGTFVNRIKSSWRDLQTSIAQSASDGTGKEFMDTLASTAEKAVPKVTELANKAMEFGLTIRDNWKPIKETIIAVGTGVVAMGVAFKGLAIITSVTAALKGTTTVLGVAKVAMHGFNAAIRANPIGAAATAIGLLVAGGVLLYRNWDTVTAKTKEVWASIGGLEGALRIVTGPIGMVVGAAIDLAKNWDSTKSVWENVWGAMKRSAAETVNSVIGGINKMIETINLIPGVNIPIIAKVDWGTVTNAGSKQVYSARTSTKAQMASFAVGSNRIGHDQIAQIHKDEMILPSRQAEKVRQVGGNINNIDKLITKSNGNIGKGGNIINIQFGNIHADQLKYEDVVNRLAKDIDLALSNM